MLLTLHSYPPFHHINPFDNQYMCCEGGSQSNYQIVGRARDMMSNEVGSLWLRPVSEWMINDMTDVNMKF